METKTKTKTTKTKVPVQDKKVIDAHRSLLSKTEASEQQVKQEFRDTFTPVVVLLAIIILLQFAILVN